MADILADIQKYISEEMYQEIDKEFAAFADREDAQHLDLERSKRFAVFEELGGETAVREYLEHKEIERLLLLGYHNPAHKTWCDRTLAEIVDIYTKLRHLNPNCEVEEVECSNHFCTIRSLVNQWNNDKGQFCTHCQKVKLLEYNEWFYTMSEHVTTECHTAVWRCKKA